MSVWRGTFRGANVFLYKELVPPELFDVLHDALRLNGAQVFLCFDPSRNAPNDYHIISSPDHEKFEDLRSKGCNLVGPQCILSCAKEHRMLPKRSYTCCLAMDGVKVIASGFERDKKAMIEKQITAMGGVLQSKVSMDVNFVIVKSVLSAKYKWALHVLKKPIVTLDWLCQCWIEHRVVPQEPYRVLPFMGLTICVTRILADEREGIKRLISQNGGLYSADLTKKCSHLVSAPDGDKYMAAKKWGHIHIVNRKWFDQSISRRACLDEDQYPVQDISSCNDTKILHKAKTSQGPSNAISQFVSPAILEDLEAASSQNISISDTYAIKSEVTKENPVKMQNISIESKFEQAENTEKVDLLVAQDSEEDNDLYLSSCRICLLGFEDKVMRKLLSMIRGGGGTRHTTLSEKLTHIILGTPSETEMKDVRCLAAWGVINVVNATWLEESYQAKRELSVSSRHIFPALTFVKDSTSSCKEKSVSVHGVKKVNSNPVPLYATNSHITGYKMHSSNLLSNERNKINVNYPTINDLSELKASCESSRHQSIIKSKQKEKCKLHSSIDNASSLNNKATFSGKSFCFSVSFPIEQRAEVIEWVNGGGGVMLDDQAKNANFIIECHGLSQVLHANVYQSTIVTTHWIRSSLEDGCMQDVANHILYSPLRCHVPLPGFEVLRFCVSQYDGKERILLKNLCYALGAKFTEKLTKKVTHLLCKFTNGPKYEAAFRKGIQIVTADWINECVSQDKLVPHNLFQPRPVTSEDKEADLCSVSQYPTQDIAMISFSSQSQSQHHGQMQNSGMNFAVSRRSKETDNSSQDGKRLKLSECDENIDTSERNKIQEVCGQDKKTVPDVADAIEDLLAQSDKIQDLKSPGMSGSENSIFAPDRHIIGQSHQNSHSSFGIPKQWSVRPQKQDNISHTSNQTRKSGPYDPFSETQTESQVVGYEEDLTGRQKIIERVRSQSLTLTSDVK